MAVDAAMLPRPAELDLRSRLLFHGSVAGDVALRTALSSVVGTATLPGMLARDGREEQRRLAFYAERAQAPDAAATFAPPPGDVAVETLPGHGPGVEGGRVEVLRFKSPFVALNPDLRREYAAYEHNAVARAQHWRHDSGPRPTLAVIHGFGASPAWFNAMFFSLKRFFAEGWDVVLFTLPFHGARRESRFAMNGLDLFRHGYAQFHEAILQAIQDFRVVLDHIEASGAPRTGVTGLSLGGYVSALLAAAEPRLDFVIPNAAVTAMPRLMRSWWPSGAMTRAAQRLRGTSNDLLERSMAIHSPLSYPSVVAKDRLMVVGGLGDRLAPPEQSLLLWEHWDRPRLHWFPGSHVLHFERRDYLDAMRELMAAGA